jgi:hypothetical protein
VSTNQKGETLEGSFKLVHQLRSWPSLFALYLFCCRRRAAELLELILDILIVGVELERLVEGVDGQLILVILHVRLSERLLVVARRGIDLDGKLENDDRFGEVVWPTNSEAQDWREVSSNLKSGLSFCIAA